MGTQVFQPPNSELRLYLDNLGLIEGKLMTELTYTLYNSYFITIMTILSYQYDHIAIATFDMIIALHQAMLWPNQI